VGGFDAGCTLAPNNTTKKINVITVIILVGILMVLETLGKYR
jgi:hypothetical protein